MYLVEFSSWKISKSCLGLYETKGLGKVIIGPSGSNWWFSELLVTRLVVWIDAGLKNDPQLQNDRNGAGQEVLLNKMESNKQKEITRTNSTTMINGAMERYLNDLKCKVAVASSFYPKEAQQCRDVVSVAGTTSGEAQNESEENKAVLNMELF